MIWQILFLSPLWLSGHWVSSVCVCILYVFMYVCTHKRAWERIQHGWTRFRFTSSHIEMLGSQHCPRTFWYGTPCDRCPGPNVLLWWNHTCMWIYCCRGTLHVIGPCHSVYCCRGTLQVIGPCGDRPLSLSVLLQWNPSCDRPLSLSVLLQWNPTCDRPLSLSVLLQWNPTCDRPLSLNVLLQWNPTCGTLTCKWPLSLSVLLQWNPGERPPRRISRH